MRHEEAGLKKKKAKHLVIARTEEYLNINEK